MDGFLDPGILGSRNHHQLSDHFVLDAGKVSPRAFSLRPDGKIFSNFAEVPVPQKFCGVILRVRLSNAAVDFN